MNYQMIRITKEQHNALKLIAEKEKRSITNQLEVLLDKILDKERALEHKN